MLLGSFGPGTSPWWLKNGEGWAGNLTAGTTGRRSGCTILAVRRVNWRRAKLDAIAIGARKRQTGGSSWRGEEVGKHSAPFYRLGKQGEGSARESGHRSVMKNWCAGYRNEAGRGFDETTTVQWGRETDAGFSATRRRRGTGRRRCTTTLSWEIDGGATVFGGRGRWVRLGRWWADRSSGTVRWLGWSEWKWK
jgi:hypothetical protein